MYFGGDLYLTNKLYGNMIVQYIIKYVSANFHLIQTQYHYRKTYWLEFLANNCKNFVTYNTKHIDLIIDEEHIKNWTTELEKIFIDNGFRDFCWIKTPGKCSNSDDDMQTVCSCYINSDLVIFSSPVVMGFTSALLKRAHDRLIPLLTPYVRFYGGESHHLPRYEKYPTMSLLLEMAADTDNDDMEIISDIYRRDALNFHAPFVFLGTTERPVEEVADAIDRI